MFDTPKVLRPLDLQKGDAIVYQRRGQNQEKLGVVIAVDNSESTVTLKPLEVQSPHLSDPNLPRIVFFLPEHQYPIINFVEFDIRFALIIHESHFDPASDNSIEYLRGVSWIFRYQGEADNYDIIVRSPAYAQYILCIRLSRAIRKALYHTKSSTHISVSISMSPHEWLMFREWFEEHQPAPAQVAVRVSFVASTYDSYTVVDKMIRHERFKTKIDIITTTIHVEVLERKVGLPSLCYFSKHENMKIEANLHVEADCGILFNRVLRGGETTRSALFKYDKESRILQGDLPIIRTQSTDFDAIQDVMSDAHNDRTTQLVNDPNYIPGSFIKYEGVVFEVVEVRLHPQIDHRRITVSNHVKYIHCFNVDTVSNQTLLQLSLGNWRRIQSCRLIRLGLLGASIIHSSVAIQ
jgi:hypothetical protein